MRLKGVAKRSADKAQIAVYNQSLFARKPLVLKALYHQKMIAVRNRGFYKQLCVLIGYIATEINRYKHFGADKFRDQLEIINDFFRKSALRAAHFNSGGFNERAYAHFCEIDIAHIVKRQIVEQRLHAPDGLNRSGIELIRNGFQLKVGNDF